MDTDRFKIIFDLGSEGKVKKVYDIDENRVLAAKFISGQGTNVRDRLNLFQSVSHANVLPLYDIVSGENGDFIAFFEFCGNGNVTTLKTKMNDTILTCVIRDAAEGLRSCHARNLVHGDINPQSLLVSSIGDIKIGCPAFWSEIRPIRGSLYRAPELCSNNAAPTPSGDIYALGSTIFELASGCALSISGSSTYQSWLGTNPPHYLVSGEPWSTDIVAVLGRMLDPDPKTRISASEICTIFCDCPPTWYLFGGNFVQPPPEAFWV